MYGNDILIKKRIFPHAMTHSNVVSFVKGTSCDVPLHSFDEISLRYCCGFLVNIHKIFPQRYFVRTCSSSTFRCYLHIFDYWFFSPLFCMFAIFRLDLGTCKCLTPRGCIMGGHKYVTLHEDTITFLEW